MIRRFGPSLDALIALLMALIAYGYFTPGVGGDWNSNSRMALVKAVVEEGRLTIDSYHNAEFYTRDEALVNGHYYSDKAIGSSVIGIAVYSLLHPAMHLAGVSLRAYDFKQLITFLAVALPSALLAPLLYLFVKQISSSRGLSLLVTATIIFGTPYFKYSTRYYGHTIAAMFLFAAFFIWFRIRQKGSIDLLSVLASGLCMGFMVITEYPTALLLLPLGIYILFVLREQGRSLDWQPYAALIAGFGMPLSVLLLYNFMIFGTPLALNYAHEASAEFQQAHEQGIIGITTPDLSVLFYTTFHPTMGIFWQSSALILGFVGWYEGVKTRPNRPEAIFSLSAIGLYMVVMSGFYMWWGGHSFTPRHLIPVLPLFAVPLALLPGKHHRLLLVLAVISIMQMFAVSVGSEAGLGNLIRRAQRGVAGGHLRDDAFLLSTIYDVYFLNLIRGRLMLNVGRNFWGIYGILGILPLVLMEGFLALAAFLLGTKAVIGRANGPDVQV
jgi:hypothetical protein